MRIVQKYGGTSLADAERIRAAACRAAALADAGNQVVLVVSAQGQTTDEMIRNAGQISAKASLREMDAYLSAGEQMSAGLMAMALEALNCPAVSLTGWQAGILTDGVHGNAKILKICTHRICAELEKGNIVVTAGFQGLGPDGNITTLGRGGSDTTAVALAAWLKADRCQIFTDVDGIYDCDPRQNPDARKFDRISYRQMGKLIAQGAQVLHSRSVELAEAYAIPVEVLSAFRDVPGTIVGDVESL